MAMIFQLFTLLAITFLVGNVSGQDEGLFTPIEGGRRELVPAMFIFGDSLIDNGNNNLLASFAKANYYPYGIDFQDGPTGRFSNGYTMVDKIAELLGLPLIPPFADASGEQIFHGVNYASAASGILEMTGRHFVGRIPFDDQIRNFQTTLDRITDDFAASDVANAIGNSLFFVGMGSNDYLNNYLLPNYPSSTEYDGQEYADLLAQEYKRQLTTIYNLGARKFMISGIGNMGCIPNIMAKNPFGGCAQDVNLLVEAFNMNVKTLLNDLNANLPGANFLFIDIAKMFQVIVKNAATYGFSVMDRGCCGIGRNRGQLTCLPLQMPCPNRNQYLFWDAFHPTEAVNLILGRMAFEGDQSLVYPMNIKQLANLA